VALIGACGVTAHAIIPVMPAKTGMVVFGILHSLAAFVLVRLGGYRLFEKTMSICIGLMFIVVVATAAVVRPDLGSVARGMFIPLIPDGGLQWTIALMGGIGGTLTNLCY
jgi:Mn2+/Fe2+ NRAMP family transporter